jgi:hypothetical protein
VASATRVGRGLVDIIGARRGYEYVQAEQELLSIGAIIIASTLMLDRRSSVVLFTVAEVRLVLIAAIVIVHRCYEESHRTYEVLMPMGALIDVHRSDV